MTRGGEKILCQTPTPDKAPTRIPKWKYNAVRAAILKLLNRESEIYFSDMAENVGALLNARDRAELGSLSWHVTTIKLHMETVGEIRRLPGKGRQRIRAV